MQGETAGQGLGSERGVDLQQDGGGGDGLLRVHRLGSSDNGRIRTITTPIWPTSVQQILDLQEAGATEEDLHPLVEEAITESYFTEWGTRAHGLRADFYARSSCGFPVLAQSNSSLL
jgi:hypothetical protein